MSTRAPIVGVIKLAFSLSGPVTGVAINTVRLLARESVIAGRELAHIVHRCPPPRGMRWPAWDHLPALTLNSPQGWLGEETLPAFFIFGLSFTAGNQFLSGLLISHFTVVSWREGFIFPGSSSRTGRKISSEPHDGVPLPQLDSTCWV